MWGLRWTLWPEPALGSPPSPEAGGHRGPAGLGRAQGPRPAVRTAGASGHQPPPSECLPSRRRPAPWEVGEGRHTRAAGKSFWKVARKAALRGEGGRGGRIPRAVLLLGHGKCHGQCSWGRVFKGKNAAKPGGRVATICLVLSGSCGMWAPHPVMRPWGRGSHLDPAGTSCVTPGHE